MAAPSSRTKPPKIESRQHGGQIPTRIIMRVDNLSAHDARQVAITAVEFARQYAPKVTGDSSRSFEPIWGEGYFGITWDGDHIWFQEMGIRAHTMNRLQGKTIPMWVPDPTGETRRKHPNAETRTTEDGRLQVLIFRRAARKGETKLEKGRVVPRAYPGAPGRISRREAPRPFTAEGRLAGAIAKGNVGVRWRFPGTFGRYFLREGLVAAARHHGIPSGPIESSHVDQRPVRQRVRRR